MNKPNYGIDAPGVIRNLFLISIVGFGLVAYMYYRPLGSVSTTYTLMSFGLWGGGVCFIEGVLMLVYAKFGKFRHRDRMLKLYKLRGNEQVLDIGTGRGLMMIGAAKLMITGRATGIDIWSDKDLGNNKKALTMFNAESEGVSDKVNIETADITNNHLPDNAFDVVYSNLCLHNIRGKEQRRVACKEIYRILATGGTAIISDFKHTKQYAAVFEELKMDVSRKGPYLFDTFPPLSIVIARKIC